MPGALLRDLPAHIDVERTNEVRSLIQIVGSRDSLQMTPEDFRRAALSLPGAEEGSHLSAADFRVGGRIFATLASEKEGFGNLMLSPEQQAAFVAEQPAIFLPVRGSWGRAGATHVRLAQADEAILHGALLAAWKLRSIKNQASSKKRR